MKMYAVWILIVLLSVSAPYGLASAQKSVPAESVLPSLQTSLQELCQLAKENPLEARGLSTTLQVAKGPDQVRVIAETNSHVSYGEVAEIGAEISGRADKLNLIQVDIAPGSLEQLAMLPGVKYVRRPYRPVPLSYSEGIDVTGASACHDEGILGQGIRIAIIDGGFGGLSSALAGGELANVIYTQDYTGEGLEIGGVHGSACAEILYEMAPQAQFILLKIDTAVDFYNAVIDAVSQGANVISHSMGWFNTNFYDGTGPIAETVAIAVGQGVLWVNAAGNAADGGHWEGIWIDSDSDGWMDFEGSDETNEFYLRAGETVSIFLSWDGWPATDQDYDLYLYDSRGNQVAASTDYQMGTSEPAEWISFTARLSGRYGVAIYGHDAPRHPALELFAIPHGVEMEYKMAASSITAPSNASFVFAVGAIDWRDWLSGPQEDFSSQGPTNASQYASSIVKPDICGPDGTKSDFYHEDFYGTSASAPHVAGAAALVWSARPTWTSQEVRHYLENSAIDMGISGKDNLYGYGRLNIPTSLVSLEPTPPPVPDPQGQMHTYGDADGWYMVSVPFEGGNVASQFGATAYTHNPSTGQYLVASEIEPARGYWVYIPKNTTVTDSGNQVVTDVTLDVSTKGWWQISAPWSYPKYAVEVTWTCKSCGGSRKMTKSWAEAVTAGWVGDQLYGYEATDSDYTNPSTLNPWYGYWMKAEISGLSLKFSYELGTPVSSYVGTKAVAVPYDMPLMPSVSEEVVELGLAFGCIPNPVEDVYTVSFSVEGTSAILVESMKVEVYSVDGKLVYASQEVPGTSLDWDTDDKNGAYLDNGVYLYKVYAKVNGKLIVSKVKTIVILR